MATKKANPFAGGGFPGKGGKKAAPKTYARDKAMDKKAGIKEGGGRDRALDKARGFGNMHPKRGK